MSNKTVIYTRMSITRWVWLYCVVSLLVPTTSWGASAGKSPVFQPADEVVVSASAPFLSGTLSDDGEKDDVLNGPKDNKADAVLGQPDFTTNTDTGATRKSIGYPMGSSYYVRGDSHFLFVADQVYHRIMIFDVTGGITNGQDAYGVIGQADFNSGSANRGGTTDSNTLSNPTDLDIDENGYLYVADYGNNRVLCYKDPIGTDYVADTVFGQNGSFTGSTANSGGRTASTLSGPLSVGVDKNENIYVADGNNHRVLVYYNPIESDVVADKVMGQQGSFTTGTVYGGGPGPRAWNFWEPFRVQLDPKGNLYVADFNNSRGLIFNNPLDSDDTADMVIGQAQFTSANQNQSGLGPDSIRYPCSLGVDVYGNLYMADWGNNRVLFYRRPLAEDTVADMVFGQTSFTTSSSYVYDVSDVTDSGAQRIDFDHEGNVYVSDCYNSRILKYEIDNTHAVSCDLPEIKAPATGKSVSGNAVAVIVKLSGKDKNTKVQLQYRKAPTDTWSALGEPITKKPYIAKWSTVGDAFSDDDKVWIRAEAVQTSCTAYSLPIEVVIDRDDPDIEEDGDKDPGAVVEKRELFITGSEGKDQVQVSEDGTQWKVVLDLNDGESKIEKWFDKADVDTVTVNVLGGDDQVQLGSLTTPSKTLGGLGDDQLQGGEGDDIIYGGEGNDQIDGKDGNDVVYGGDGTDDVQGGNGTNTVDEDGKNDDSGGKKNEKKEKLKKGRKHQVELASDIELDIPAALADTEDLVIVAAEYTSNPIDTKPESLENATSIVFQSLEFESGPSQFSEDITLTFDYSDTNSDGFVDGTTIEETSVVVYWLDPSDSKWDLITTTVYPDSDLVIAKLSHFSFFGIFGSSTSSSGSIESSKMCVLSSFLGNESNATAFVRDTRDQLMKTPAGRKLTSLYYTHFSSK